MTNASINATEEHDSSRAACYSAAMAWLPWTLVTCAWLIALLSSATSPTASNLLMLASLSAVPATAWRIAKSPMGNAGRLATGIAVLLGPFTPFWGPRVVSTLGKTSPIDGSVAHLGVAVVLAVVGLVQIRVLWFQLRRGASKEN